MKYLFALLALTIATPASAELIFFSEQRSMSVASHRCEGDRVIVALRGGGEMSFDRSLITKIAPDEVSYTPDADQAAGGTAGVWLVPGGCNCTEKSPVCCPVRADAAPVSA